MPGRPKFIALLVAVLGTLGWALSAAPAYAGGPTSVLLVDRVTGKASALYYEHPAYDQLSRSVEVADLAKASIHRPSTVSAAYDNHIMLTWLAHDVWVWRIDEVYITDDDGIWVSTQADLTGAGDIVEQTAHWHRPADDKALLAAISATGLLPRAGQASTHRTVPPTFPSSESQDTGAVSPTTSNASATAVPATTSAGSTGGASGLMAAGAGVAGFVVGAGGVLLYRRARSPRPEEADRFVLSG
jgi:hypothetical protein